MKIGAKLAETMVLNMGSSEHIEGEPGDYIGHDGRLHCGKCHESKEYYLKPFDRYVPSLCRCGRIARDETEQRMLEAAEMERVEQLSRYSIMDAKQKAARFENAVVGEDNTEAFTVARNYVDKFETLAKADTDMKGLLLYGSTGTGKSYLAACITNALMAKRVPVLLTSIIKLTGYQNDELTDLIEKMRSARLLVLDDLGAERGTDFKLEQVYTVIDSRLNSRKPLIVTTNLSLEQMTESGDIRYSRIWERVRAMCYPVRMNSVSWRRDKSAEALERFRKLTT